MRHPSDPYKKIVLPASLQEKKGVNFFSVMPHGILNYRMKSKYLNLIFALLSPLHGIVKWETIWVFKSDVDLAIGPCAVYPWARIYFL